MTENDKEFVDFNGEQVEVVAGAEFLDKLAVTASARDLIPMGLAMIGQGFHLMLGTAGPTFGVMAGSEALVRGMAELPPALQQIIAKMAVLSSTLSAEEDCPEELRTPWDFADWIGDSLKAAGGDETFERAKAAFQEYAEISDLEEAFGLPDAEGQGDNDA